MGPVVTPFDADGEPALAPFALNGRAHLDAGMSGLVVAGSTGEAPTRCWWCLRTTTGAR